MQRALGFKITKSFLSAQTPCNLSFCLLAQIPKANASDAEANAYAEADVDGVVADGGCLHLHRRRPTGLHYVEAAVISPT